MWGALGRSLPLHMCPTQAIKLLGLSAKEAEQRLLNARQILQQVRCTPPPDDFMVLNGERIPRKDALAMLVEERPSKSNYTLLAKSMQPGEVVTVYSEIVTRQDALIATLGLGKSTSDAMCALAETMDNDEHVVDADGKVYSRKDLLLRAVDLFPHKASSYVALADFNEDVQLLDGRVMSAMQLVITAIEGSPPRSPLPDLYTKLRTLMEHEDIKSVTIHGEVLSSSDIMSRATVTPKHSRRQHTQL